MSEALRVAVRVRPFIHEYEKAEGIRNIVRMDRNSQTTFIKHPETGVEKAFTFDFSYNSFVEDDHEDFASQETVWQDLGIDVLENAWKGFNVSLFAYGQTGAGKSHSMMGYPGQEGIVPRACREIFERIDRNIEAQTTFKVEASMLEIYNEKVRDLFNPASGGGRGLKVRDHPKKGPYVQNLTKIAVGCYEEISNAMEAGTRARTVAATAMNATSSRAHTIFQVIVTQTTVDEGAGRAMDKVSTVSLIDLAGSERADRTGASGDRLKEGCAINQSLSALGNVIFALADRATNAKKKNVVVPYRDSVLTHLLKNSLGGNAKTVMIAAISPSCVNYDETLSTLRYADRAKQIKNKAVVNEDPNQKLIRGLKDEIEQLRAMLASGAAGGARPATAEVRRIEEEVTENERLLRESEQSWEERLKESQDHVQHNNAALAKMGMGVDHNKRRSEPHICNLNQDPQMTGVLTYFFEPGLTRIGRSDAVKEQTIVLSGLNIQKEHCTVSRIGEALTLEVLPNAKVSVNGKAVEDQHELRNGDRVVFGNNHVYLCIVPQGEGDEADKARSELIARHSWEDAMSELNESQISHITEGERAARKKAEKEANEMQAKVMALEKRIQEERRKAEEEARAATDAEREKMLEKQKELEAKLQAQIDSTTQQQAAKERERRKQAVLDEKVLRTLPLISEANAISEELDKGLDFELQLVATQSSSSSGATSLERESIARQLETTVWVRVQTPDCEVPSMWDYDKFINRLYLMREMYEDFVESGRDMGEINGIYGQEYDPFYDPPVEQLIGKAYIMLAPLGFFIDIEDNPPVIQYQGKTDGALEVTIALDPDQVAEYERLDTDEEVTLADVLGKQLTIRATVKAAKGLPRNLTKNVAVSYKFFTETHRTPACPTQTINPRFDDVHSFVLPVTEELLRYIEKEPLEFQVWGSPIPQTMRDLRSSPSASPVTSPVRSPTVGGEGIPEEDEEGEDCEGKTPTSPGGGQSPVSCLVDNSSIGDDDGDEGKDADVGAQKKEKKRKRNKHKKNKVRIEAEGDASSAATSAAQAKRIEELDKELAEARAHADETRSKLEAELKTRAVVEAEAVQLRTQVGQLLHQVATKDEALQELEAKVAALESTAQFRSGAAEAAVPVAAKYQTDGAGGATASQPQPPQDQETAPAPAPAPAAAAAAAAAAPVKSAACVVS